MSDDDSPLAGTEVHYLSSAATGAEYKLFVGHCGDQNAPSASVPALYLIDGNGLFGMAVDIIRLMQLSAQLAPMVVIGIGYRAAGLAEVMAARTRDLTPSQDDNYAKLFPDQSNLGGADRFLEFIRSELVDWVAGRYPVHPQDRAFYGHSLGGLFGTYALLREPATFSRSIISSPSLWWHGGIIRSFEESYAGGHDDLAARVFFAIGSDETHDGRGREAAYLPEEMRRLATAWYIDMVDDLLRLVVRLEGRRYPSLEMSCSVFPDEFHVTVPALTMSRGLRALFDAPR